MSTEQDELSAGLQSLELNEETINVEQERSRFEKPCDQLNSEQKKVFDYVAKLATTPAQERKRNVVFIDGPSGSGKTFCYKAMYHDMVHNKKMKVLCVAHTGIAAALLPKGITTNRAFRIPFSYKLNEILSLENAKRESLDIYDAVIWDEACMSTNIVLNAVDKLFRQMHSSEKPFGGVLFIMGGDWRQTLPILKRTESQQITNYTIKNSSVWKDVKKFKLTMNQRAIQDEEYAKFVLAVGNGENFREGTSFVDKIEENFFFINWKLNSESQNDLSSSQPGWKALADWVFEDIADVDKIKSNAVLTVTNESAFAINDCLLKKVTGDKHTYKGTDALYQEYPFKESEIEYTETFSKQTPTGVPLYVLNLKVGAQVMLLKNLDTQAGLCNGTRLTVVGLGENSVTCTFNFKNEYTQETVIFKREWLDSPEKDFKRFQFPLRLAYCSTINKSQGQTLERAGIVLDKQCFAHGQLYVALSRVRNFASLRICSKYEGVSNSVDKKVLEK